MRHPLSAKAWVCVSRGGYPGSNGRRGPPLLQLRDSAGLLPASPFVPLASGLWCTSTVAVCGYSESIAHRGQAVKLQSTRANLPESSTNDLGTSRAWPKSTQTPAGTTFPKAPQTIWERQKRGPEASRYPQAQPSRKLHKRSGNVKSMAQKHPDIRRHALQLSGR